MSISHLFSFRVIPVWNQLAADIVEAGNLNAFKAKLYQFDLSALRGVDGQPYVISVCFILLLLFFNQCCLILDT